MTTQAWGEGMWLRIGSDPAAELDCFKEDERNGSVGFGVFGS